ncbi:hypothetical protein ES708_31452 [subsurface metagenome]
MLVLVLDSSEIPTKIIKPSDITMTADSYDILLENTIPGTIPPIVANNYGGAFYINYGVPPGTWTAKITAYDDGPPRQVVGALGGAEGTPSAAIVIDKGVTLIFGDDDIEDLSIIPIIGQGGLTFDLVWQDGITPTDPVVEAYLIPVLLVDDFVTTGGDFSANKLTITVPNPPGNQATYNDGTQYNHGYYGLFITVKEVATPVAGVATSVRIVANHVSHPDSAINLQEVTGTLTLDWDLDLQNPADIEFTETVVPTVSTTGGTTITPIVIYPSDSLSVVDYYYQWFVDGTKKGNPLKVTGTVEYTIIGADYVGNEGTHQLSLLIYGLTTADNLNTISTIGSETLTFAVE